MDDLEGDTHGDFEDLLVALVTPTAVYDCHEILKATKVRKRCMFHSRGPSTIGVIELHLGTQVVSKKTFIIDVTSQVSVKS